MSSFTPEQIEEFLQEFFDVVGARQYVGARYVPIFGRAGEETVEWDDLAPYEPLTVVMHEGVSYVSRRYVPAGILITDTAYWVETYRFNAQVEQYRQQVLRFQDQIDDRVPFPDSDTPLQRFGQIGQVLSSLGEGFTQWADPVTVTEEVAGPIIDAWLDDHPEATTSIEDDSITAVKLKDGAVPDLKLSPDGVWDGLNQVMDELSMPLSAHLRGTSAASNDQQPLWARLRLRGGETYTITVGITASAQPFFAYILSLDGTTLKSVTVPAGQVTYVSSYTPSADVEATVAIHDSNRSCTYEIAIVGEGQGVIGGMTDDITALQGESARIAVQVRDINAELEMPFSYATSGTTQHSTAVYDIGEPFQLSSGMTYTLSITAQAATDRQIVVYLRDADDENVRTLNLNPGQTSASNVVSPELVEGGTYHLAMYDSNNPTPVSYEVTLASSGESAIDRIRATVDSLDHVTTNLAAQVRDINAELEMPFSYATSGTTQHSTAVYDIGEPFQLSSGMTYTLSITAQAATDRQIVVYLRDADDENVRTLNLNPGQTSASNVVSPELVEGGTYHLAMYDSNNPTPVSYEVTLASSGESAIDRIMARMASPVDSAPTYLQNAWSLRQVGGAFNIPYLILSCDDGTEGLEAYTIPMLLAKQVPCTFALWSTPSQPGESPAYEPSVILQSESGLAALRSAVAAGCEIAQHGNVNWTDLTESQLNDFFDREAAQFATLGFEVKGAVYPSHCVNNRIRPVVGGRFLNCRAGYSGYKSSYDQANAIPGDIYSYYPDYMTGAKSNTYSFSSFNVIDKTLAELKEILDKAIARNLCMVVYWHDWNFMPGDANYQVNRTLLESFIDYAKTTTVTFRHVGDLAYLR